MSAPGTYLKPDQNDLVNKPINMILYSHPGIGKTVFWGSGGEKVLFISSDPEGTISAAAQGHRFHEVIAEDYDDLDDIYAWLKHDKPDDFSWIVWDSLTLFQNRALQDDIMVDASEINPNQEEFVPSKREYLISINRIGKMVRQFGALPYNTGVSCHVELTKESGGDERIFMPQIQGRNMPSKISGYMSVVGYMDFGPSQADPEKEVQRIQFQPRGRFYAKDRWDALGDYMDRPTLPKVEKLIEERRAAMIADRSKAKAPAKKAAAKKSAASRARAAATKAKAK